MIKGKVYRYSAYYFKGGHLIWIYDSHYEVDPDNPITSWPLDRLAWHGIKPTLLVVEREDDFVAFHYERGRWTLHQVD